MTNRTLHVFVKYLIAAVAIISGTIIFVNWNSDIHKVQRRFEDMIDTVNKSRTESLPVMAVKAHKTLSFFTLDTRINPGVPFPSRIDKTELKALLLRGRQQVATLDINALGYETIKTEPDVIQMDVTLDVTADTGGYSDRSLGTYRVYWSKINGNWLISSVEPLDIVKHPSSLTVP